MCVCVCVCGQEDETIKHLFWQYRISHTFWPELKTLMDYNCTHCTNLTFSEEMILFDCRERTITDKSFDIFSLAQFYVYECEL